jgi:hypothetical protein
VTPDSSVAIGHVQRELVRIQPADRVAAGPRQREREVRVHVDEPRHDEGPAEVDHVAPGFGFRDDLGDHPVAHHDRATILRMRVDAVDQAQIRQHGIAARGQRRDRAAHSSLRPRAARAARQPGAGGAIMRGRPRWA